MVMNERNATLPDGSDPQLSDLYRAAPAESPPAHLDAAIQAAARRAVGARPRATGASLLRAWRVPLSIAAVLVMSVSMVTLTVRQKGGQWVEPPHTASVPALRSEPVPATPLPPDAGNAVAERPAARVAKPAAEAAAAATDAKRKSATADVARMAKESAPIAPEPGAAATTASAQPAQAFSTPAESVASAEHRAAPTKEEHAAAPARSVAKALRAPAPAAPEPAASAEAQIARRDRAAAGMPAATVDATPPVSILIREFEKQPPEKWLEKIAALRQQGKTAEADELLAEFKKRYPNHPLPSASR